MEKQYKIYNDGITIDPKALHQFFEALKQPWATKGAVMADGHAGYSLPIGGVVSTKGVVVPAWVGFDKGCGVFGIKLPLKKHEIMPHRDKIFDAIYEAIPTGFAHNKKKSKWPEYAKIEKTAFMEEMFNDKNGFRQLCSLGGGNHFIEIGYDENNDIWIIIHSGSRNVGHSSATNYMRIASGVGKAREGHYPLDVNTQEGKDYITDLNFCLEFALENRRQMASRVIGVIGKILPKEGSAKLADWLIRDKDKLIINRNHNHAELKDGLWIHRKGATHAEADMLGVIPGNMEDGSFIVKGKGNPDSLCSSSHGAGRVMGRREAKEKLSMSAFRKRMKNSDIVAKVEKSTLDESKLSYKDPFEVMAAQSDLVHVMHHVKPLINIKA